MHSDIRSTELGLTDASNLSDEDIAAVGTAARGRLSSTNILVMVALWNRTDHYIFMLWFVLSSSSSSFFPRLISAAADWMSAILPYMVWS